MKIIVLVLLNLICYNIWFYVKVRRTFGLVSDSLAVIKEYLDADFQEAVDERFEEIADKYDDGDNLA